MYDVMHDVMPNNSHNGGYKGVMVAVIPAWTR